MPAVKRLILIVDDLPENLQVLAGHLTEAGFEVLAANNGPRAIALVRNRRPDLILLDIMMPDMDGFDVCKVFKDDPDSADIPIIFITARTDTDDIVKGLEMGAVDYVTKPFKVPELLARVRTHVELKTARDLFTTYSEQLKRISSHLRRLNADKNRFLSIVSHDIRGAFGNVVSVSRLLTEPDMVDDSEAARLLTDIGIEAEHMIALAENLLNIDAIERQEVTLRQEQVDVHELMEYSVQAHQMAVQDKKLKIELESDNSIIWGDLTAARQILTNLLSNAVKYSPSGSTILVKGVSDGRGFVLLSVHDQGPGLSPEDQKKLFLPFMRLNTKTGISDHSVGLGLSIVKLMCEGMGGTIRCDSVFGEGATFTARLPMADS